MEIIDELENNSRHIYTGFVGYIDFSGDFDFNIAIRTIIMEQHKYWFNVGGGITWNSNSESEYLETYYKGQGLLKALGKTIMLFINEPYFPITDYTNGVFETILINNRQLIFL